jgi:Secretion system C-terminal sorting domain
MSLYTVPVFSSTTYRIQVTDTSTGCTALSHSDINIIAPGSPSQLSSHADFSKCWVKPGNRFVHFIQPGTTRILASINPKTNDLGEVEVFSYVNANPINIQACGTYQTWYQTAVLNRNWMIEPDTQPASEVDVRLYFDESDFTSLSNNANLNDNQNDDLYTIPEIILSKYSGIYEDGYFANNCGNGSAVMFNSISNGIASSSLISFNSTGRYIDFRVPGFSEFWLHGNSNSNVSALPVQLLSFSATCVENNAEIKWQTLSEINNEFFKISKSKDAINWDLLNVSAGANYSNQPLSYKIIDDRPYEGTSYYRLSQKDFNGDETYFEPVSFNCEEIENEFQIFPNPTMDYITISSKSEKIVRLIIYTINGQKMFESSLSYDSEINIDVRHLNRGIYSVQLLSDGGNVINKRIVIN